MEIEIDTAIPNTTEEDLEIDGKEGAAIQDQNPKEDTEITEIVAETGEIKLLRDMKENTKIENTEVEIEKIERIEIEEKERAHIKEKTKR